MHINRDLYVMKDFHILQAGLNLLRVFINPIPYMFLNKFVRTFDKQLCMIVYIVYLWGGVNTDSSRRFAKNIETINIIIRFNLLNEMAQDFMMRELLYKIWWQIILVYTVQVGTSKKQLNWYFLNALKLHISFTSLTNIKKTDPRP